MKMQDLKMLVLMGGPGSEREVSLRSGSAVAEALLAGGHRVEALEVKGRDMQIPEGIGFCVNMIHGTFGEDGELQAKLDVLGIPYTGEGERGSRLAFDKLKSKRCFDAAGVRTPRWEIIASDARPTLSLPLVVKAPREGSSVGVHIVKKQEELDAALVDCALLDTEILVEEFIEGRELTVGVVGDRAMAVVEICPRDGFYDYEHKYTKGASDYFCPAALDEATTRRVQEMALAAHRSLELEVYSRVDILLRGDGEAFVLEANTIPGMTATSLLPKAAAEAGISFLSLCEEIIRLSAKRYSIEFEA